MKEEIKGIIIIKDISLQTYIQDKFPEWLVLASSTAREEISFYPTP